MAISAPAHAWARARRGLARGLVAALAFSCAVNLLALVVPLFSLQLFDRVLASGHVETLILLSLITAAVLATLGVVDAVRSSLLSRAVVGFEAALSLPAAMGAARLGSGAACLRDLAQLRHALTGPLVAALADLPWLPLVLIAAWVLHPLLAAFTGASVLALAALALINDLLIRRPQRAAVKSQLDAQTLADAVTRKLEVVRAMGMAEDAARRVGHLHIAAIAEQQRAVGRGGIVMGLIRALRLGTQAGVMGLGAFLVLADELTPGAMLAASILAGRALAPVEQLVAVWRAAVTARDAWARLRRELTLPAHPEPSAFPILEGRLVVEAAAVRGTDGRVLLKGVSLALEPGECLAVAGPSGAGKSTLCRLLTGIIAPTVGAVELDGARLDRLAPRELSRWIGYLPQETMLFAGSVAENIARLTVAPDAAAVVEAARLAGAHEMIARLPQGYDTGLDDGAAALSGGQRQRLALARALYGNPRLVVLDEPDAHFDGQGEAALAATLARLKEVGATVVLVTHRPQALRQADKILVLEDGAVSSFGPREAVLAARSRPARAA